MTQTENLELKTIDTVLTTSENNKYLQRLNSAIIGCNSDLLTKSNISSLIFKVKKMQKDLEELNSSLK